MDSALPSEFLILPGSVLGALWPLQSPETALEFLLERTKAIQECTSRLPAANLLPWGRGIRSPLR